jgi:hypothetical protein
MGMGARRAGRDSRALDLRELVTNAIKATHGRDRLPPVRLHLCSDKERLLIEVWDADPRPPAPARLEEEGLPALADEGGRGLFLVAALSQQWNWYPSRESGGKVVWCELQLTTGNGHQHGADPPGKGAPPSISSPASYGSTEHRPQAACASAPGQASAPGTALPLRPQPAKADAKRRAPADPEILQRVKAALTRL